MGDTENRNPLSKDIDAKEVGEILGIIHSEDLEAVNAVGLCLESIEKAVRGAVRAIEAGGTVVYIGAGTSGRLGVLDAAEVYPTFSSNSFRGVIAGGTDALSCSVEGAEDDENAGVKEGSSLSSNDMAIGISASGTTPFVMAALKAAKSCGAQCWLITNNEIDPPDLADGIITVPTGPEVVAGSTRLKAGTATKLVLNMISTATMIRLGGVHDGLMVDVVPSNEKLIRRAEGIIMSITGCTQEEADESLKSSGMKTKTAALMRFKGIDRDEANMLLSKSSGSLRRAIDISGTKP